jgi:cell wall-associated NlpC family hydrolase
MSIDTAVSRISSILSMERALWDPVAYEQAASAASAATTAAATTQTTGTSTGGSSFSNALSSALVSAPGATTAAGATPATGGAALTGNARIQAMVTMADSLVGKPYVWGGGHSGWGPQAGYDCSGFVSAVLHAGGYLSAPADTTSLPSQAGILAGPGQYVTIYDRDGAGQNGHVIIELGGQFYESGGQAGAWGGGGGVEKIGRPSDSYLATFDRVLHPAGL